MIYKTRNVHAPFNPVCIHLWFHWAFMWSLWANLRNIHNRPNHVLLVLRELFDINLHVCLFHIFKYRHTLGFSAWSSTPTRTCPSIQRTSLRCTEGRRGMRCLRTFMPSLNQHTAACFKVCYTSALWKWTFCYDYLKTTVCKISDKHI